MNFFRIFTVGVIILSAIRGVFVYHLGWEASATYLTTAMLFMSLGLFAIYYIFEKAHSPELIKFSNIVKINLIVQLFYFSAEYFISSKLNMTEIYIALGFPIIFILINTKESILAATLFIIVITTTIGIYITSLLDDYEAMYAAKLILRPDTLEGLSRIGDNFLPFGYQADNHDAANILMFGIPYIFARVLYQPEQLIFKRILYLVLILTSVFALLMTGSAANISIFLAVMVLIAWKKGGKLSLCILILGVASLTGFIIRDSFLVFLLKYAGHSQLENGGLFNALNFSSILDSLPSMLFGFGYIVEAPMMYSEVAFAKVLISVGIFGLFILLSILFAPLTFLRRINMIVRAIGKNIVLANHKRYTQEYSYLVAIALSIISGSLSMIHYGSLFRITSIGAFTIIFSIFFKKYMELISHVRMIGNSLIVG